jgi:hypothetical protein
MAVQHHGDPGIPRPWEFNPAISTSPEMIQEEL